MAKWKSKTISEFCQQQEDSQNLINSKKIYRIFKKENSMHSFDFNNNAVKFFGLPTNYQHANTGTENMRHFSMFITDGDSYDLLHNSILFNSLLNCTLIFLWNSAFCDRRKSIGCQTRHDCSLKIFRYRTGPIFPLFSIVTVVPKTHWPMIC